ncbi:MAG TPA: DUF5691 domain-containing protein, partial [Actinomycetes bacterium]|nr:DUF5691 domain-containing protein [Actinomycetes bacterium]
DRDDAEGAVLKAGAALGLYRQAGARPAVDDSPRPVPAPEERRPYCSVAAAERLKAILAGRYRPVLGEWLRLAAGAGLLVPPDRLPALLHAGSVDPRLRAVATEVIGERGRWLGGRNPAWAWASGTADDEAGTWATGSRDARRLLLARLRSADPSRGRELLASTWATETAEDRAAFLAALATGLSMDDEPFLEAALDDRRKEVRQAAAGLLWGLPGSRLGARMAERARLLVQLPAVRLPTGVDPAMVRDGVVVRPPAGVGERAWWLHQLVSATPLSTWTGDPPRLVEQAPPALRQAWAEAAARQRNDEWAMALLEAGDIEQPALLAAVSHDRAVAVATGRVAGEGLTPAVLDLLDHCPDPWGPELSGVIVERLGEAVKRPTRPDGRLVGLAARLHPTVAAAAVVALGEHSGRWSDVVGWFLDLLTFRAEMYEELPT